jgi:hypothetical protein
MLTLCFASLRPHFEPAVSYPLELPLNGKTKCSN